MKTPDLQISLQKLHQNILALKEYCARASLQITPVTKVVMGHPVIASLYSKHFDSIGDSRICDIERMIQNHIHTNFMLIRSPALSESVQTVKLCRTSLNTELSVCRLLNEAGESLKKRHQIIVMIEMGDLREGILPDEAESFFREVSSNFWLDIIGIGTNATCFAGLIPTPENLAILEKGRESFRKVFHKEPIISGGGTNLLHLLLSGTIPSYINHIRIGEGFVMGVDAVYKKPIPGCATDVCILTGEIIELKTKPSYPAGETAHNAFGEHIPFKDKGLRKKAIVNIGRLDTDIYGLIPIEKGIEILGASSDHLMLDIEEKPDLHVGDTVSFSMNYSALLFSMSSIYVVKNFTS